MSKQPQSVHERAKREHGRRGYALTARVQHTGAIVLGWYDAKFDVVVTIYNGRSRRHAVEMISEGAAEAERLGDSAYEHPVIFTISSDGRLFDHNPMLPGGHAGI